MSIAKDRNPGDLVKLKSGSTVMTVKKHEAERVDGYDNHDERVLCYWMTADGKLQEAYFAPEQLIDAPS